MSDFGSILSDLASNEIAKGVLGNAAYEGGKAVVMLIWSKLTHKTWEDLLLDSLADALYEYRPLLQRHTNQGDVTLQREQLRGVLKVELRFNASMLATSQGEAVLRLAAIMADRELLSIGGHDLSRDDYEQLVTSVVRHAVVRFQEVISRDQRLTNLALLESGASIHAGLQDIQNGIDRVLAQLADRERLMLIQQVAIQGEQLRTAEAEIQLLRTRIPELDLRLLVDGNHTERLHIRLAKSPVVTPTNAEIAEEVERERQRLEEIITKAQQDAAEHDARQRQRLEEQLARRRNMTHMEQLVESIRYESSRTHDPYRRSGGFVPRYVATEYIDLFREKWERYLQQLVPARRVRRVYEAGTRITATLALRNVGKIEASNIQMSVRFPPGSLVYERIDSHHKSVDKAAPLPSEPTPPWISEGSESVYAWVPHIDLPPAPAQPEPQVIWNYDKKSAELFVTVREMLATQSLHFKVVCFIPPEIVEGFHMAYSINARGMSAPATGLLRVEYIYPTEAEREPPPQPADGAVRS